MKKCFLFESVVFSLGECGVALRRLLAFGFWLLAFLFPLSTFLFPLSICKAQTVVDGMVLDTLKVQHIDAEGVTHEGELICAHLIANDLRAIFAELYKAKYPIERIRPISEYGFDDERSMQANNTSCFCYRAIAGTTRLSKHGLGMAVDINPLYNPCVQRKKDGTLVVQPSTGKPYVNRKKSFKYKITKGDLCYRLFIQHGFRWGGDWKSKKDYQHFEREK